MHENVAEKYKVTQLLKVGPGEGRGGGGYVLCAAEQGMVFTVLSLQSIQFHH